MVTEGMIEMIQQIGHISDDGYFLYAVGDRKFQYTNTAFKRILGINEEVLNKDPHTLKEKLFPEDLDYLVTRYAQLLERRSLRNIQFQLKIADEVSRHLSVDCYLLQDGQEMVVGFVKDITKIKEHDDYIVKYGNKKDAILEMLSHNLSGPLNLSKRVLSLTDKAFRDVDYKAIASHLDFVKTVTQHCIDTIAEFLEEEHLVSERIYVKQNRFDIVKRVQETVDRYTHSYPSRKIQTTYPADHLFVTGDDIKFVQIINNLLSNAVKFTPANCEIELIIDDLDDRYRLIIKDDGIGIPAHLQPLIFQRYTPAGRPGLQGEKSIGIGLSIVKKLVELMKGEIYFESKQNIGTTFVVTLPKE
jgi:two-component system sensor histidine kinase VicK